MNLIEVSFDRTCDQSAFLAEYAKEKIAHTIYDQHGLRLYLRCCVEKDIKIIKALIKLPSRPEFLITAKSRDMYKTVGLLMPKLKKHIKHELSMMHRDKKYHDHRKAA